MKPGRRVLQAAEHHAAFSGVVRKSFMRSPGHLGAKKCKGEKFSKHGKM